MFPTWKRSPVIFVIEHAGIEIGLYMFVHTKGSCRTRSQRD